MASGGTDTQDSSPQTPDCAAPVSSPAGHTIDDGERLKQIVAELDPKEKKDFEKFLKEASKIRIMVTGETGVGKSTILNALVGTKVFEVGRKTKQRVTIEVTEKICKKDDCPVEIIAIDCPGLHDGTDNEEEYLRQMKDAMDKHGGIDLLLYCKKMDVTRADVISDVDIIQKLTRRFGAKIWKHALFVLTFANNFEKKLQQTTELSNDEIKKKFRERKDEWQKVIEDGMKKRSKVKCKVKVCPTGHKKPHFCGRPYWLSDFWASACTILKKNGGNEKAAAALVLLNQSRMGEEVIVRL